MKTVTYDEMLWKLVPVEPTEEMLCAGDDVLREAFRDRCIATRTIYDAMLASTPAPAQQETSEGCDQHWSYYFKVMGCKAKTAQDGDCICWHTEGTGPFDMVRHDDADQFLEWRESPSSAPAPAQQEPRIPAEFDVRSILLSISPWEDGMGYEVYAASVADVEGTLTSMGQELEEWQLGIRRLPTAAHQEPPQPVERKPMTDPCPGCTKGHVCRTPKCGRLALPVDHPLRCPTPGIRE